EYHFHEPRALGGVEVRHLARVALEDHAAKPRVVGLVHAHDAAKVILPEHRSTGAGAELAGGRVRHGFPYSKTRSIPPLLARSTNSRIQPSPRRWRAISTTM